MTGLLRISLKEGDLRSVGCAGAGKPRTAGAVDKLFKVVNMRGRDNLLKSLRNTGLSDKLSNVSRFFLRANHSCERYRTGAVARGEVEIARSDQTRIVTICS